MTYEQAVELRSKLAAKFKEAGIICSWCLETGRVVIEDNGAIVVSFSLRNKNYMTDADKMVGIIKQELGEVKITRTDCITSFKERIFPDISEYKVNIILDSDKKDSSMNVHTPLDIEVLLHYYSTMWTKRFTSESATRAEERWADGGFLERRGDKFLITDKGRAMVTLWLRQPMPETVYIDADGNRIL